MLGEVQEEMNPTQRLARITGGLYLCVFVFGFFAVAVQGNLVVPGDAATTANNILDAEWLFAISVISWIIVFLADVAVSITFYFLLKPVSDTLSLVAAAFRLAMAAIMGINLVNLSNALFLLTDAESLTGFDTDQVNDLALIFVDDAYNAGVSVGLVFFGIHILVLGYLLFTSRYVPRILGVPLIAAGFGYIADSLGKFLLPNYDAMITEVMFAPGVFGEFSLTLWLLIKGVNVQQWHKRAYASP
jgi:hypothetical protein